TLCNGANVPANCVGAQQFVYTTGSIYIQYWLLNYNKACPSSWSASGTACFRNSTHAASVPAEPITNLVNMTLIGQAGAPHSTLMATGTDTFFAMSEPSARGLNKGGWTSAEFNVFGGGNSSQANLQGNVTMVVQTLTNTTSPTTAAPTCFPFGITAET